MELKTRNNQVNNIEFRLRAIFAWALSSTVIAGMLVILCGYAFISRPTKIINWQGDSVSFSDTSVSPSYLRQFGLSILQYRLTFTPNTIDDRFTRLMRLVTMQTHAEVSQQLTAEEKLVKVRKLTSVFYPDLRHLQLESHYRRLIVPGELYRTEQGVTIPSVHKVFEVDFTRNYFGPVLLTQIKEVAHVPS